MMSLVYDHCVQTRGMVRLEKSSTPELDEYEFDVGSLLVCEDVTIRFFYFNLDRGVKTNQSHDVSHSTLLLMLMWGHDTKM